MVHHLTCNIDIKRIYKHKYLSIYIRMKQTCIGPRKDILGTPAAPKLFPIYGTKTGPRVQPVAPKLAPRCDPKLPQDLGPRCGTQDFVPPGPPGVTLGKSPLNFCRRPVAEARSISSCRGRKERTTMIQGPRSRNSSSNTPHWGHC